MNNPKNTEELKARIRELEVRSAEMEETLKLRMESTYESLKPYNLFKSTIQHIISDSDLKSSILYSVIQMGLSFAGGHLLNRGSNIARKAIGAAMQLGARKDTRKSFAVWKKFLSNLFAKNTRTA